MTVTYTANSTNAFPNVLGLLSGKNKTTWSLSGSSTATASIQPNINFYLLLDNSPSMAIPATTRGHQRDGQRDQQIPDERRQRGWLRFRLP